MTLLGQTLGRTDLRDLRKLIGWSTRRFDVPAHESALSVVLTGATATLDLLRREIPPSERERAHALLDLMGIASKTDQPFGTLSAGERGRTLIARALLAEPRLLLLDEPFTGLDLPGRESLRPRLSDLAARQPTLASIIVTHHLEELPASITHAALLRDGRLIASGQVAEVLTSQALSTCFGIALDVEHRSGHWLASARAPSP